MSARGSKLAVAAVITLAALGLVALAAPRDFATAGDGFGVYFPVVRGLWRGDGLLAFTPLRHGTGRMPGYPTLLALTSLATPDLTRAAQLANLTLAIALFALLARALRPFTSSAREHTVAFAASTLVLATSPVFVRAVLEPLPDLAFTLTTTAVLTALAHAAHGAAPAPRHTPAVLTTLATAGAAPAPLHTPAEPPPTRARDLTVLVAGLFAGVATLVRFNGIILTLAGPLALAFVPELRRARLVLSWLAGFALGLAPLAVPALALAAHGIDYPFLSFAGEPGQGTAGSAAPTLLTRVGSMLLALASTPARITATATLPAALLGTLGLALAARRAPAARAIVVVLASLALFLAPLHFEARYFLFVLPPLALAAALVVVRIATRAGLRETRAYALVLTGAAALALTQLAIVRDDEARAKESEAEAQVLCTAFATRAATKTPVVVGLVRGTGGAPVRWGHVYTRLRDCPRPTIEDPPILLTDTLPGDHGLDLVVDDAERTPPITDTRAEHPWPKGQVEAPLAVSERPVRASGDTRAEHPWPKGQVGAPRDRDGAPLAVLELPVRPSASRCARRVVEASAGEGTIIARLGATSPHVAHLSVRTSSVALRLVAAGLPAKVVEAPIVVGSDRRVELELCASDPLRAVGAVVLDELAIIPGPPKDPSSPAE